jgi:hypothetical protein
MYPGSELARLATRKELILARIAVRRLQCAEYACTLARPLGFIDRMTAKWRQISPWIKLVGIPLGVIVGRRMSKTGHDGKVSAFLKYVPIVMQAVRLITKARAQAKAKAEMREEAAV